MVGHVIQERDSASVLRGGLGETALNDVLWGDMALNVCSFAHALTHLFVMLLLDSASVRAGGLVAIVIRFVEGSMVPVVYWAAPVAREACVIR